MLAEGLRQVRRAPSLRVKADLTADGVRLELDGGSTSFTEHGEGDPVRRPHVDERVDVADVAG